MDLGALSSGFLTGLREGVEAALIIAIICAYLARTGNRQAFRPVIAGTGMAIGLSVVSGIGLYVTAGALDAPYQQLFEAVTLLLAAVVVTWMLFWMRRQARSVKSALHGAVDRALGQGSVGALAVLAFVAVIREGLETSLFLVGQASSADSGAIWIVVGAVIGLAVAAVLGVGFYEGSRRFDLAAFFRWTGVALVFIAAGLLSTAVHELVEIGIISFGTETLFDLSAILPHAAASGTIIGPFLRALFGYSSTPEITTFVVWLAYLVIVLYLFLRPTSGRPAPVATNPGTTAAA